MTEATLAPEQVTDPTSPKGRLLAKAAHLFKTKGYERTTVRDLAAEVGIQSGSIFHHFKTKEDILQAVMSETIVFITGRMRAAVAEAATPKDKVLALIRCELQSIIGETGEAMSVLVYEWRSLSPEKQKHILELRAEYEAIWLAALDEAKAAGLIEIDTFILRRLLTGAANWTVTWFDPHGPMNLEQLAQSVLALAVKG